MSHIKKKRKKYESIRDVFFNCDEYYNVDRIIKCLKWIHGKDKIFHHEEDKYSWDFYWKNEKIISFKSPKQYPLAHEYIISTLERYYIEYKLEKLGI